MLRAPNLLLIFVQVGHLICVTKKVSYENVDTFRQHDA